MIVAANPLIEVTPGLMIWTLICFGITFYVLKRFAFGPMQSAIDARRERIRQALEEADLVVLLQAHRQYLDGVLDGVPVFDTRGVLDGEAVERL